MKKLLTIISIFFVVGCGYAPIDNSNPVIINKIKQYDAVYSKYFGKGNSFLVVTSTSPRFMFLDSTGKWNIGDTVILTK